VGPDAAAARGGKNKGSGAFRGGDQNPKENMTRAETGKKRNGRGLIGKKVNLKKRGGNHTVKNLRGKDSPIRT